MIAGLTLPVLTVADPPQAGEGSLDPLGTGALADRIADALVPDVRARMSRVRFLTAMAVGSIVRDEVGDVYITDGRATPALAFEWLLLEGFIRRNVSLPSGVPGTRKAQGVRGAGNRLGAATYLKAPGVFGFNGVYRPLATGIDLVTHELLPTSRAVELVGVWEKEQELPGFLNGGSRSAGGALRQRLVAAVRAAVDAGACREPDRSPIWRELPHRLVPLAPGPREARLLRGWVMEHPVRGELSRSVAALAPQPEHQLLDAARASASVDLRERIDAAVAYEALAARLDVVFQTLLWRSTALGLSPLTPAVGPTLDEVVEAAPVVPSLFTKAADALAPLGLHLPLEQQLGVFAESLAPAELVSAVLEHHHRVQAGKPPGKRPWFEPHGKGFVVRPAYRVEQKPSRRTFVHPMRVASLHQFLQDTAP